MRHPRKTGKVILNISKIAILYCRLEKQDKPFRNAREYVPEIVESSPVTL